jgi:hypothetical protein
VPRPRRDVALASRPGQRPRTVNLPFTAPVVFVVACSAAKAGHRAPAALLYRGAMFRHSYAAAVAAAAPGDRVLIMSALHGLLRPEREIDPYDLRLREPGSAGTITLSVQAVQLGLGGALVACLLPRAYWQRLYPALARAGARPVNLYDGCRGIGEQRAVNVSLAASAR